MKQNLTIGVLLPFFVTNDGLTQERSDVMSKEMTFEKRVAVTREYNAKSCQADLFIQYFQKVTNAHVRITLVNKACGASSGAYKVRIQYKDAQREIKRVEFKESWGRDDDANVISEKDYFVGDDIDIVRVDTQSLSCECKGLETETPTD